MARKEWIDELGPTKYDPSYSLVKPNVPVTSIIKESAHQKKLECSKQNNQQNYHLGSERELNQEDEEEKSE